MMMRKTLFWAHLSIGITAGLFIFIMAATGILLAFEKQVIDFVDRDIRFVAVPEQARPRPLNELLDSVRRSGAGDPTAIVLRDDPQAATQVSIGRGKTVYVDPYSGAVLGSSSGPAHQFFFAVERLHRALGAPLGSRNIGHWLAAVSNLLFGALILLGVVLWLPRRWNWKAFRAIVAFRPGLKGRACEWNWHNVLGVWCAVPLLVVVLTGVVMSFDWANALLFRLTGSTPAASGRGGGDRGPRGSRNSRMQNEPNYDHLFTAAMGINPAWRTITIAVAQNGSAPVSVSVDTGTGGQPQNRTQYLLNRDTGTVVKTIAFTDSSLGQRLRAFVRFGHTGEYGGLVGQAIAGLASLGACVLVYTGFSLALRRLAAKLKQKQRATASVRETYAGQSV
ncbi:MAG: PepSY-associated TM helix domain-containing protein [Bryobacteraceae bacterium]